MKRLVFIVLVLVVAGGLGWRLHSEIPPLLPEIVFDEVFLFSDEKVAQMETYHEHLLKNYDIDFRVHTVESGGNINMSSVKNFKTFGVGSLSHTGRGILFTVDIRQDKVRVEISAGLEGIFTDAFVSYIERKMMVPYFTGAMVPEGIMAATEMFVTRARESGEGISFDTAKMKSYTTGAGAAAKARLGEKPETPVVPAPGTAVPKGKALSPRETVAILMEMLMERKLVYDPLMYTRESVAFFSKLPVIPAAVDNMYRSYKDCVIDAEKIEGEHAVVRYRPQDRLCGPFFFVREDGRWKFDLISVRNIVIYDFQNRWMLRRQLLAPFAFGFTDWDMLSNKKFLVPKL